MRIGYDTTPASVSTAGVVRYINDLGLALDRLPDIDLVRFAAPIEAAGGRLQKAVGHASRRLVYYPWLLKRQAGRSDVSLIHCPAPHVPQGLDVPLVMTIHDMLPWRYPEYFSRREVLRHKVVARQGAQRSERIIVGSEYTAEEVVDLLGISRDKISVTRLGLDLRFQPVESTPMWLARRFGIPGRFVLATGTREPHKGLVGLVRAFERFQLEHPEYTLVVVGSRPAPGSAIEQALNRSTARIVRAGFVSDEELVRLYGSAACFAFPSLYEGFGFPPIEAMACGCPVITSDRASLPETVGDAALRVDPTDPDLLSEALERVLLSPQVATDLRDRGLVHARGFTWGRTAAETVDVYRSALESAAG